MVGEPVAEYVRRLRLERAGLRLIQSRRPVTDIAFEAGYQNLESFIRAFKQRFSVSPSQFRKQRDEQLRRLHTRDVPPGSISSSTGGIMNVHIIRQESRTVACVRHIGPYKNCGAAWETLCRWAGPLGLLEPDTAYIGLCYDDPDVTPPDKIRYDACITVTGQPQLAAGVALQTIPGGLFATTIHIGPMENLIKTYVKLCGEWLPQSGYEAKHAPNLEIYLNDPSTTAPQDLRIEIQLPLEEA